MRLLSLLTWLLITLASSAAAGDAAPQREAPGRLDGWVPEDVPVLRGIFFEDGSFALPDFAEVLSLWGYAGLRGAMFGYAGKRDQALRDAMSSLAVRTGHPEIPHLPVLAIGFSRFSGNADSFPNRFPGRVISFASGFDPSHPLDSESQRTPNVKIANEVEDINAGDRSRNVLGPVWPRTGRPLRAYCPQWREIHSAGKITPFLLAYWDQVQRLRVPADWDPKTGPATLKPIAESEGWLGDITGFWTLPGHEAPDNPLIAPFADFPADRRTNTAWLPDQETAWLWRAWCSRLPWGRFESPCKAWEPGAGFHNALGLRAGATVAIAVRITIPDAIKVDCFAWSTPVAETATITGGDFGSTTNAVVRFTWTPPISRVWPLMIRITRAGGAVGWITPVVVPVHPAR